jgi:uroporphyrinogen-III synthase
MINGDGITAALLQKLGINTITEEEITPKLLEQMLADS